MGHLHAVCGFRFVRRGSVSMTHAVRGEQCAVLAAFKGSLDREAHNLASTDLGRLPSFVFQQLYNRLQWHVTEGECARSVAAQAVLRASPGNHPWFHLRTRPKESEALVRTLEAHLSL